MENAPTKPPMWRKVVISGAIGAVVGGLGGIAMVPLFKSGALSIAGPSEVIAAAIGLIYALVAACVAAGLASPGIGARFLNVEDADELRDQRRMLAYAAAVMAATGGALIVLAFAGPGGMVPRPMALAVALALFVAPAPLALLQWRHMDELMRSVTAEAGNLAYYLILLVGGGWAMLAHLDFIQAPAPLDWLTMLFGLVLVASFIAAGRRGMLVPR